MLKNSSLASLVAVAILFLVAPISQAQALAQFDLPSQPLAAALRALGSQTSTNVLFDPPLVEGRDAPALKAELTLDQAFSRLLAGTGLKHRFLDDKTVMVVSAKDAAKPTADASSVGPSVRLAQSESDQMQKVENQNSSEKEKSSSSESASSEADESSQRAIPEILVTGSRLTRKSAEGAQAVRVYGREEIERSGQTTVSGFLNGLPGVSSARQESPWQTYSGQTTVRLRGLPVGTTLVLIDGQRVETSGTMPFENVFDLNNIPVDAVERFEILSSGTSIYGSDGIAGVVNILLKDDFEGLEVNARYAGASGIDEAGGSVAWGHRWERGSLSLIGNYQDRSELRAIDRELTASNDFRRFGGLNNNRPTCHPGNVFFPNGFSFNGGLPVQFAAVPAGLTGTPRVADFAATAGTLNTCGLVSSAATLIPATQRMGLLVNGEYELTPSVSLFSNLLYSRTKQQHMVFGQHRVGSPPTFQNFTVPATNPYNPFGTTVAIAYAFLGRESIHDADVDFGRALLGARGNFGGAWAWEMSALQLQDWTDSPAQNYNRDNTAIRTALNSSDLATAINPFIDGPAGSAELLRTLFSDRLETSEGRRQAVNGLMRGPILKLPAGAIEVVFGGEYAREKTHAEFAEKTYGPIMDNSLNTSGTRTDTRKTAALFGEARVPILSAREQRGDVLAVTLAARYDHYSDFGSTTNPQFAAEWRPLATLLVRGTYAEAFKAPSLRTVNDPFRTIPSNFVTDPITGQQTSVPVLFGGNPDLRPEVGQAETFGVVYSSRAIPDFRLSLTHWVVKQTDTIQRFSAQAVVNNEAIFPGRVVRDVSGAIQSIDARTINFGGIDAAGLDYDLSYRRATSLGIWSGSVSASQIYNYDIQLVPEAPVLDRVGVADITNNWAPRWKGAAAVGWQRGPYAMSFMGRYVSRYRDYDGAREIGNFWLYDANLRYELGQTIASESSLLKGVHLEFGAVNVFNTLPQYSNFDPFLGYDPAQGDIRGRFLYLQAGFRL